MKPEFQEPSVDAAIEYFINMAKGNTIPTKQNGQNGLGAVRQSSTYHAIPAVKLVTPTAQAVERAKAAIGEQEVIRRP